MAARSLSDLFKTLPGEVSEKILRYTFEIPAATRDANTPASLHLLQVTQRTRTIHSTAYYGNGSVFRVHYADLSSWAVPLSAKDKALIGELKVDCGPAGAAAMPQLRFLLGVVFATRVAAGGQFFLVKDMAEAGVVNVRFVG